MLKPALITTALLLVITAHAEDAEKKPMSLTTARATVEAAHDTVRDCKAKVEVYGKDDKEHVQPCIQAILKMQDAHAEAIKIVSAAIKDGSLNMVDSQLLTNAIQETAVDIEYIAIRMK